MEFQVSYFKSWKMMLWKCCTQYDNKFGKLSSGHRTGKGQFSFQSQRKAMPKNAQTTTAQLHSSHTLLLLLLVSHSTRVWLCATPEMAAHQASPSLGFSRQEHWRGFPFPSPVHESEKWKWSHSVVSDSSDPMDCSLPGSSVHRIFQARVLEWGAIAFSISHASNAQNSLSQASAIRELWTSSCSSWF